MVNTEGVKVAGHNVNNLRFADDTVNTEDLQQLLHIVEKELLFMTLYRLYK